MGEKMTIQTDDHQRSLDLVETIKFFSLKGWTPATSTNYSVRSSNPESIIISRSGVDKSTFLVSDLIQMDLDGKMKPEFNLPGIKPSAETDIHLYLYRKFPEVNCVLHTHSVLGTALSVAFGEKKGILFENLEILKGLEGNNDHLCQEWLPIVQNSQKMSDIISEINGQLTPNIHGFLIQGHGLYTWGKDIASAKRHIETYEFLFHYLHSMRSMSWHF